MPSIWMEMEKLKKKKEADEAEAKEKAKKAAVVSEDDKALAAAVALPQAVPVRKIAKRPAVPEPGPIIPPPEKENTVSKEITGDRKERAFALLKEGKTVAQTAIEVGVSTFTIYNWKKKAGLTKKYKTRGTKGGKRKTPLIAMGGVDDAVDAAIQKLVEAREQHRDEMRKIDKKIALLRSV